MRTKGGACFSSKQSGLHNRLLTRFEVAASVLQAASQFLFKQLHRPLPPLPPGAVAALARGRVPGAARDVRGEERGHVGAARAARGLRDGAEPRRVVGRVERQRGARAAAAARAADAVDVVLGRRRRVVAHDAGERREVEAAARDVRRHEEPRLPSPKLAAARARSAGGPAAAARTSARRPASASRAATRAARAAEFAKIRHLCGSNFTAPGRVVAEIG